MTTSITSTDLPRGAALGFHIALRRAGLWAALIVPLLSACSGLPKAPSGSGGSVPSPASDRAPTPAERGELDVDAIPDAVPRVEPRSRYGNPPYYEVMGRRYYVRASSEGYRERGIASWYGAKFHGRRTSSGETYDMYAMTAAHATLPIPTYVEVTNLRNGRKVVVKVNDRGPFHANRLIDLSYVAALKLGIVNEGTGLVEIRALSGGEASAAEVADAVETASAPGHRAQPDLYLQVGAFSDRVNAERLSQRIGAAAPRRAVKVHEGGGSDGRPLFRVRLGPLPGVAEVDRVVRELAKLGIKEAHVVID